MPNFNRHLEVKTHTHTPNLQAYTHTFPPRIITTVVALKHFWLVYVSYCGDHLSWTKYQSKWSNTGWSLFCLMAHEQNYLQSRRPRKCGYVELSYWEEIVPSSVALIAPLQSSEHKGITQRQGCLFPRSPMGECCECIEDVSSGNWDWVWKVIFSPPFLQCNQFGCPQGVFLHSGQERR